MAPFQETRSCYVNHPFFCFPMAPTASLCPPGRQPRSASSLYPLPWPFYATSPCEIVPRTCLSLAESTTPSVEPAATKVFVPNVEDILYSCLLRWRRELTRNATDHMKSSTIDFDPFCFLLVRRGLGFPPTRLLCSSVMVADSAERNCPN